MHCFAGCSLDDILNSAGLKESDIFPQSIPKPARREVAHYRYYDEHDKLLFEAVRYEPKDFRARRPDRNGGWIYDLNGVRRVPYNLPALLRPVSDSDNPLFEHAQSVFIVEGEKDVETLKRHGFIATCNFGGAGNWKDEDSRCVVEHLQGRQVVIIPDEDEAGRRHTRKVAYSLKSADPKVIVKTLTIPDLVKISTNLKPNVKIKDISDYFDAGGDAETLKRAVQQYAKEFITKNDPKPDPKYETSRFYFDGHHTELNFAEYLAELLADKVRYDHASDRWLIWNEHYWKPDLDGEIERLFTQMLKQTELAIVHTGEASEIKQGKMRFLSSLEKHSRIEAVLKLLRTRASISSDGSRWDADPLLIGAPNGVLDLKEGRFREGRPQDNITRVTRAPYEEGEPERWLRFLDEVFDGDKAIIEYVRLCLGYTLTGLSREQVFFFLFGEGANGKSVFLSTLQYVLGDYATKISFPSLARSDKSAYELAELEGKRFCNITEASNAALDTERIKAFTGENDMSVRQIYQRARQIRITVKLWLAGNHKPRVPDDSYGFWRRIILIPFTQTFSECPKQGEKMADSHLSDKLLEEGGKILHWLFRASLDYLELPEGTSLASLAPKEIKDAVEEYREESLPPVYTFLREKVLSDSTAWTYTTDLYTSYTQWAQGEGYKDRDIVPPNSFGKWVKKVFPNVKLDRLNRRRVYKGIRVKGELEELP
jgi:putative DNA primase/helicase